MEIYFVRKSVPSVEEEKDSKVQCYQMHFERQEYLLTMEFAFRVPQKSENTCKGFNFIVTILNLEKFGS